MPERLAVKRGALPKEAILDNRPELTDKALDQWAYQHGVRPRFTDPGEPRQIGLVESFNSRLRDEAMRFAAAEGRL